MSDLIAGQIVIMGRIDTVDDPDDASTVVSYHKAILIQFDTIDDCRQAIADGKCEFEFKP